MTCLGGILRQPDGRYQIEYAKIRKIVEELATALLVLRARGSYDEARKFIDDWASVPVELEQAFANLKGNPPESTTKFFISLRVQGNL